MDIGCVLPHAASSSPLASPGNRQSCPVSQRGNGGSEEWSNLDQVTQLVSDRAWVPTRSLCLLKLSAEPNAARRIGPACSGNWPGKTWSHRSSEQAGESSPSRKPSPLWIVENRPHI